MCLRHVTEQYPVSVNRSTWLCFCSRAQIWVYRHVKRLLKQHVKCYRHYARTPDCESEPPTPLPPPPPPPSYFPILHIWKHSSYRDCCSLLVPPFLSFLSTICCLPNPFLIVGHWFTRVVRSANSSVSRPRNLMPKVTTHRVWGLWGHKHYRSSRGQKYSRFPTACLQHKAIPKLLLRTDSGRLEPSGGEHRQSRLCQCIYISAEQVNTACFLTKQYR